MYIQKYMLLYIHIAYTHVYTYSYMPISTYAYACMPIVMYLN